MEFFRFRAEANEWKKLTFSFKDDGSVLVVAEQGKKGNGNGSVRVSLKLEQSEVALLQTFLFKGLLRSL